MSIRIIPGLIAVIALSVGALAQQLAPTNRYELVAPSQGPKQNVVKPPVKTPHARKPSAKKVAEQPPQPPAPQPTPTLEQQPPIAPQVTYSGGQLMVNAPNSRLSDVLASVRRATGIPFDGATSEERVAVRLGPGSPHDVINALLHGSHLDYVIVGAENDPAGVKNVLLTAPSSAPGTRPGTVVTQNVPPGNAARPLPPNPNTVDQGENNTDEVPDETVTEQPPENANVEGNNEDQQNNQNNGEVQNNDENQQQPKTPQQLLQELQQLQQQQNQNMQNQQNQQNQNQPVQPGQPMPNQPNPNQNEQRPPL